MAEEQVNSAQVEGQDQAQSQVQAQGQGEGQQAQKGSQQQYSADDVAALESLRAMGKGKDYYNIIASARKYDEFDRDGWTQVARISQEKGWDGFSLASALATPPEQRTEQQQDQVADATPKQVQQAAAQQGQYLTPQQAQQMIQEGISKGLQDYDRSQQTRSSTRQAQEAEAAAYDEVLKEAGFENKPTDVTLGGKSLKRDVFYQNIYKPALAYRVAEIMQDRFSPSDPDYVRKISQPAPPEVVRLAAADILPLMKSLKQQGLSETITKSKNTPVTLPPGVGGRAAPDLSKMSREEQKAEAIRRARKRSDWQE